MRLDPQCFDAARFVGADSALSRNTLALLTTLVAFGVSGAFLLSLVPDRAMAPDRGAIAPEPRPSSAPGAAVALSDGAVAPAFPRSKTIRVEKDGRWRDIAPDDIFAVRANAHYTYVYDGEQEYFCSLSIGAVAGRLDPALFLRVHRSHIVAVRRIARVKRAGENGIAELGSPVRCSIPIARAHYREVKQLVKAADAPAIRELRQLG